MAFPEDILEIKVEAGGLTPGFTWTDITDWVYKDSISITRGSADESSRTQPSSARFLLNNLDGRFSPRNPTGPYYGLLKKNTPLLISVMGGDPYLDIPGSGSASVADTAQLDITGDIDVRVDATLYNWAVDPNSGFVVELAAKRGDLNDGQFSWQFGVDDDGGLVVQWSPDGTDVNQETALSTVSFTPSPDGRLAVRFTIDVDNGSSEHVVTFYTAPTMDGPWEQLGEPVTGSGTTSIFSSTGTLRVGNSWGNLAFFPPQGKFWGFQLYDGINGDLAAGVDFTQQTVGDTSFTGDAGETWTAAASGAGSVNNQQNRFRGEITGWPARWTTGGFDAWVPLEAKSLLQRHNQGQGDLRSTLARRIPTHADVLAYWPMEDGEAATSFGALTDGAPPITFTGEVTPAAHAGPDGSDSLPSFGANANWVGNVPGAGASSTGATVEWIVNLQQVTTTERTIMYVRGSGTIHAWRFLVDQDTGRIIGYNRDGTEVVNQGVALDVSGEMINQWVRWRFKIEQDGANVDWTATWVVVGGDGGSFSDTYAGTCGRFTNFSGPNPIHADIEGISWGHIAVFGAALDPADDPYNLADHGFSGEDADARFDRLIEEGAEEGIFYGARDGTQAMGAQRPAKYVNLLEEIAAADYGIFSDSRDWADHSAFVFIGKSSLYNDSPRLILDYEGDGQVHAPLDPTDDDLYARNSVTATRERGSSAYLERATEEEGPNSIEEIGKYDTQVTVNIEDDADLPHIAGWELHLGTWDEERYPTVLVRLQAAPGLIGDAAQVNIGSRIRLVNSRDEDTRTWIPPGDIELQVRGYRETLSQYEWEIEFQCVPARPWDVAVLDYLANRANRIDTDGAETVEALDETETAVDVITTSLDPRTGLPTTWTDDVENYPFDVTVGGEVMRTVAPGGTVTGNPFFDTDTTGWTAQNASVARSTAFVHPDPTAVASALVTPDGTLGNATLLNNGSAYISVNPGGRYVVSGWIYSPTGYDQARLIGNWHTSGGTYISTSSGTITAITAGEWTYLEETITAPSTAARLYAGMLETNSPTASEVFYAWGLRANRLYASWAYDEFGRTSTDTWSTTDSLQSWTNSGGVAGDYDVLSGYGRHINQATSTGHHSVIAAPDADFDIVCDITTAAASTGASQFAGVIARYADANNLYEARVEFATSGAITLTIRERVASVETQLDTFTSWLTHTATSYVTVRFQGTGSSLKAKVWRQGQPEPDVWQCEATDSDLTSAGSMGVKSVRNAGNTNANAEFRFDNFEVLNPQTLSVERSFNGVVKSHSSGASVALTYPMILAL